MGIFKAYDIRGIYPGEIHEDAVRRIGYHLARLLGRGPIVVGRDMRPTSPGLAASLADGVRQAGLDVIDLGMATTPMVYFATGSLGAAGGAVVTASHNPAQWNGVKLCREQAIPIGSDSGLGEIQRGVERGGALEPAPRRGETTRHDVIPAYRAFLHREAKGLAPIRVAIDTGNGTVGPFVEPLLDGLPIEVVPLYFEPDGTFPNHEANPLKLDTLRDLQRAVIERGCALGVAFDGDGDRCAIIDERGRPVPGDVLTALLARRALAGGPGVVLYDLRSTRAVREEVERLGGEAVETRVGHAFIKRAMRERGALFAGELSGHYYFRECYCAESAFLAAIRAMQIAAEAAAARRSLSSLVDEVDRYPRTGEVNFHVDDKSAALARLEATFADAASFGHLDGLTIRYPRWWANVRPSNTEPLLRLNLEADDRATLEREKARLVEVIGGTLEA
jgi:phosphomannomutase